jgi:hypothetical protein
MGDKYRICEQEAIDQWETNIAFVTQKTIEQCETNGTFVNRRQ